MTPIPPLPAYIRTKAEALAVADLVFPKEPVAMAALLAAMPGCKLPRYHLDTCQQDLLYAVFEWLYSDKGKFGRTRIYKSARFHLFDRLAHNLLDQVSQNVQARGWELDREYHARHGARDASFERLVNSIMPGDGAGI